MYFYFFKIFTKYIQKTIQRADKNNEEKIYFFLGKTSSTWVCSNFLGSNFAESLIICIWAIINIKIWSNVIYTLLALLTIASPCWDILISAQINISETKGNSIKRKHICPFFLGANFGQKRVQVFRTFWGLWRDMI